MNNKKIAMAALVAAIASGSVSADLYISPVLRGTITYDKPAVKLPPESNAQTESEAGNKSLEADDKKAIIELSKGESPVASLDSKTPNPASDESVITGTSTVHGNFAIQKPKEAESYGKNVPLFVALEQIIPSKDQWAFNVDDGLKNSVVTWSGGTQWEDILNTIASNNGLFISVNHDEMTVGISKNEDISKNLAMKIPQVWRLDQNKSLRGNLEDWAVKGGWTLIWDSELNNIDYPIISSATLTGRLDGEGGAVDRVMKSLRNKSKPLTAIFYTGNGVMRIVEAGYKHGENGND
jgi:hypothetical protein